MTLDTPSEVTLGLASKLVARGQTTVRDWIKNGNIQASRNNLGHWLIDRNSLLAFASSEGAATGPRRVAGATSQPAEAPPRPHSEAEPRGHSEELVQALRGQISLLQELLKEERERIHKLESERTQHLAEMRALLNGKNEGLLSIKRWLGK